ncbi:rRNA processing Fyv7, putative [Babesia ovata]|uniref:rRNA processing Fyv7, putative n=1 Tax=Babesia ovata TaxID=189622 RepID=A0A2H6K932_9APIC|nr:rRNA processing Fyv7, putative [Babesia ovata]GBE59459.1 rRNA processing Fyv7, putative [Babesia ovata]
MAKTAKVKGYGAYWKGDIKNKTIKRKNKQYISDQRCLQVYKKELQKRKERDTTNETTGSNNVNAQEKGDTGRRPNVQTIAEHDVKIIKPQIETVYYVNGSQARGNANIAYDSKREEPSDDGEDAGLGRVPASHDASGTPEVTERRGGRFSEDNHESDDETEQSDSDSGTGELENHDELQSTAATSRNGTEQTNSRSNSAKGAKTSDRISINNDKGVDVASNARGKSNEKQKGKFTGVYAKALKLREEKAKIKQQQHNERIEKIKQKKREIREKKQERYARHRLLGQKTKRGQPIMANVISHLMNNFEKKYKQT